MAKNITKLKDRFPFRDLRFGFKLFVSEGLLPYLLFVLTAIICYLNYQPGTFLIGWDNLQSDLDIALNFKRSLFAVWQEYQSLGLLGGMAHAADLPRNFFLGVFYIFGVSTDLLRYLWVFICLCLGSLGTYFLLRNLLVHRFDKRSSKIASFLGGTFYLLNLATIQYFFTPFETFHTFYGFLPWLLLALISYLTKPKTSKLIYLALLFFFASPAFYTQTLFVVFYLCLIPFYLYHLLSHKNKKRSIFSILNSQFSIISASSFWLLPVIFFVLTNGGVGLNAKMNLVATPETYLRNLEFGNIKDLALLKGFWFNYVDLAGGNKFGYLMQVWRTHLSAPTIQAIGYLSFFLVLVGIYYSLKKKIPYAPSFLGIFSICYFFLLGGGQLFNNFLPLIAELFRSPFTKFSIVLALSYSFFFSVGCIFLLDLFQTLHSKFTYYLTLFTVSAALIIFATPVFTGNLISPNMRLKIPSEYFQLFDLFKNQDPATRIANFPQHTFWGWNFYNWGYRGSGFIWYGIKQPILDRAFDVWSKDSEKYYEEVNSALYSQDQTKFESLLDKYAVNWIVIDKNITAPGKDQSLFNDQLIKMLSKSKSIKQVRNLNDSILVYETSFKDKSKNFLSLSPNSPLSIPNSPFDSLPLRPIPTGSSLSLDDNAITLRNKVNLDSSFAHNYTVTVPSISQSENYLPVNVSYRKTSLGLQLKINPITPSVLVDNNKLSQENPAITVDFPLSTTQNGFILELDGNFYELQIPDEVATQAIPYPLATIHLPTRRSIKANLYANTPTYRSNVTNSLVQSKAVQCYTNKPNRKIETVADRNSVTIYGTDVVACLPVTLPYQPDSSQLISLSFKYSSATLTPADANITNNTFGDSSPSVSLPARKTPTFTRIFSHPQGSSHQANFLLEANETKSTQEITYADPLVAYHDSLGSSDFFLPKIPLAKYSLEFQPKNVQVEIPLISSPLTITANALSNNLNPNPKNCDNFNTGTFDKTFKENFSDPLLEQINQTGDKKIDSSGFLYKAINANSCDQVDLKALPHDTNYALIFDTRYISGLPITTCLENHSSRRCDVFERLDKVADKQMIIQPISNPNEGSGYTLHFFNQSFGTRPTENLVRSITATPFPLNFLQNISISSSDNSQLSIVNSPLSDSSHPAEFLYTAHIDTDKDFTLNLYQSYSPYWLAIKVDEKILELPTWRLILSLPYFYLANSQFSILNSQLSWHNSFSIPAGHNHYVIFYAPQYLEFAGLLLLPLTILIYFIPHFLSQLSPFRRGNSKG